MMILNGLDQQLADNAEGFYTEPTLTELELWAAPEKVTKDNYQEMSDRYFEQHTQEAITRLDRIHEYLFNEFIESRDRKRIGAVTEASRIVWERLDAFRSLAGY